MYKVDAYHNRPCYVKGDLEEETIILESNLFKTKKAAKEYIENHLKGKNKVFRDYNTGNTESVCYYYTGKTWQHENAGYECKEAYIYRLNKIVTNK